MLGMPVATLRVWERRYSVTQPALSPSGQRLYAAQDVHRLALLKQLTERGHAIGSLATLDMAQLQQVAATHADALATTAERAAAAAAPPGRVWRLAVVGAALGARLQRPGLLRRLGPAVRLLGPFDDAAQAAAALRPADMDAWLVHEPQLHAGWLEALLAAAPAFAGLPGAVLYGFAADPVCEALATAGTALLREPQPDAVVAQWLHKLSLAALGPQAAPSPRPAAAEREPASAALTPRRWDDAALADFAGRSSSVACECPRHVAELLVQLAHFETYSAECAQRNAADAALHAHLQQVAAAARLRFEAALEHVALHEGLMLPASPKPSEAAAVRRAHRPRGR